MAQDGGYRYCPKCAATLEPFNHEGHVRRRCPDCGWIHYRNPTAGVAVIFLNEAGLWLGRRRSGGWCIPCGHVEWDETVEQAARREAREEMGLEPDLQGVFAVLSNFHDSEQHTVGIWFLASPTDMQTARAGGDLLELRPFPLDKPPELAFPTDEIVVRRLQEASNKKEIGLPDRNPDRSPDPGAAN
jgi:ADP-ribose pyrophosphatase YjhB (NUDIX family)